jgi:hypothetical protein
VPALEDFTAEIPPTVNNLFAFRRSNNPFHGHLPHEGERKAIQVLSGLDVAVGEGGLQLKHDESRRQGFFRGSLITYSAALFLLTASLLFENLPCDHLSL